MKRIIFLFAAVSLLAACSSGTPSLKKHNIDKVIDAMTVDEKVRMLVGTCTDPANPPYPAPGTEKKEQTYVEDGINTSASAKKVQGSAGESYPVARLGISSIVYADGPAGLRIDPVRADEPGKDYRCTAFPSATLLASTWDTDLVRSVGESIGEEVLEHGVDIILGPGMNIKRNPLTGRNFEYYSEDPLLTGKMAAAMVGGIQSNGVGTSVKHFAANNQETYRNGINVIVSDRALRELYLRGFEIVVKEAAPWTVMSSYNKINGVYASEDSWLLDDVLRGEWGFDGYVVTDWWGADDPVRQMEARNNLLMPGTPAQIATIRKAVEDGSLDESVLDRNLQDLLSVMVRTPSFRKYRYSDKPDMERHAAVARKAASEGMVLLENNGVLPVAAPLNVALFGNCSYDTQVGGSGSGYVHRKYKVNISDGLEAGGFVIDSTLQSAYSSHIASEKSKLPPENFWTIPMAPELALDRDAIEAAAARNDVAVFTIGRMSGEGEDRSRGKGDYLLSDQELSMLEDVCNAFHNAGKKVIAVVNAGDAIEFTGWNHMPDAVLMAWLPGQEAGNAVADVLSGRVNPSGRLPMTIARSYDDIPSSSNFGVSQGETNAVRYEEDLMVGYRYFTTAGVEPEYPFGYGLSYTSFSYESMEVAGMDEEGNVRIDVTVRNVGDVPGKDVVQVYVGKPAISAGRPVRELCAFAKTPELLPGEETSVGLFVDGDSLRQWDEQSGTWTVADGMYVFSAGTLATEIEL